MKKSFTILMVVFLLFFSGRVFSQGAWSDDFSAADLGSAWYQSAQYGLSQSAGELKISVNKTIMWAGFGANIPVQDFTTDPVLNIKVKSDQPFQFTAYLLSDAGNVLITQPVMASSEYTTVSFDFTGMDVNSNVLNAVKGILFAFNGAALSWNGTVYFDEVSLGTGAVKYSNFGALPNMSFYQGTTGHKVFVRGISNATALQLTGADAILDNVTIDPVSTSGTSWIHFDCKPGVDAAATVTLTAVAEAGYTDNSENFSIDVEGNRPPTLDDMTNIQGSAGILKEVQLSGITDGNGSVEQPLVITASSSNTTVLENPVTVSYDQGSRYASLSFTPATAGTTTITITVDDQSASNNTISKSFDVEVLEGWNNPPTVDFIPNGEVLNTAGEQTMTLKGISDGDDGSQQLVITATSSDPSVIPDPVLTYSGGKTANLSYTPVSGQSGVVTFTVSITDNGGVAGNNGDQTTTRTFKVETYDPPLKGYVIPFDGTTPDAFSSVQEGMRDYWYVESMGVSQTVSYADDGGDKVFQVDCNGKSTWTGAWYYTPDMDLTDFPLLSMWVKSDQDIRFHLYFYDDSLRNNEDHHIEYAIPANTWTKVDFDFSDPQGMYNSKGLLVNAKRIKKILFNYHPSFGWPFTNWTGTVQFKDIRIGDQSGITPTYYCTVDPVGQHTFYLGNDLKTINLTGITRGKDNQAQVSVSSTEGNLPGLSASAVNNGTSVISFTPSISGIDTIVVTISGADIDGKTPVSKQIKIPVAIVDKTASVPSELTTDPADTHQTYMGLGATDPGSNYIDLFTGDYGATAVRIGIFDNQVELVNDNADPFVLDMSKLNYKAFDWNYFRELKARGVETFILTLWSPPAWMKENLSLNYQQGAAPAWETTTNKVMVDMYDEYAEDVLAVVKMFKQEADIDITAVGVQNEPAFCEPYASAVLSPDKFAQVIAKVGQRFEQEGITTKLYGAEQVGGTMSEGPVYSNGSYLAAFDNNPDAQKYNDIFALHGYASDGIQPGQQPGSAGWAADFEAINANGKTRELWMTETEPSSADWMADFNNAANILTAFESGNVSLWTEWAWDGHCIDKGKPTQKFWSQSMFSYIKPGAVRITSQSGSNDILSTAWVNDAQHGGKTVIVLMNKGLAPSTVTISQQDMAQKYTVYRCSENVARFKDNSYQKGDKLLLAPQSIVTLVSGVEGEPTIDAVADQIVFIDDGEKVIDLNGITDGYDTNQYPIAVDYSFSDNTILGGVTLDYTSPGQTGTFTFQPAKAGTTEVTLNVTSNNITSSITFNVVVKDYNLPTINPVTGDFSYEENSGTQSIPLSGISDGGDGGQALTVSAEVTSSNPADVVNDLAVDYTSPSGSGQISFTPGNPGTAEITVTVTDNGPEGKNTVTTTFNVEVTKLYNNPTIDPVTGDRSYVEGAGTQSISLGGITDGGDGGQNMTVSAAVTSSDPADVVGNLNVTYTSPSETAELTFTPDNPGTAEITVTVTDDGPAGKNTTTTAFTVEVTKNTDGIGNGSAANIKLYPNPVTNKVFVEIPANTFIRYSVIAVDGTVISQQKISGEKIEVDVASLPKGFYLLILEGRDKPVILNFIK